MGRTVYAGIPEDYLESEGSFAIAIGDNWTRERVWLSITNTVSTERFPALVHPSASIAATVTLGCGSVVLQNATVGSMTFIGIGCIANSGSIIDHQSILRDFSSIAPGALLGGGVEIGKRSFVGMGATVSHNTVIGSDSIIGSLSFVNETVPDRRIAFGIPARVQGVREPHEGYL